MLKLAQSGWILQAAGLGGGGCLHAARPTAPAAVAATWGPLCERLLSSSAGSESSSGQQSSKQQESHDEDWTEVIDKASGQTYYWNQRTGETTALGEDKPAPGDSRYDDLQPTEGGTGVRYQEPVEKDQTFKYTVMGVFIGVFSGWASQFM